MKACVFSKGYDCFDGSRRVFKPYYLHTRDGNLCTFCTHHHIYILTSNSVSITIKFFFDNRRCCGVMAGQTCVHMLERRAVVFVHRKAKLMDFFFFVLGSCMV